jgi:hypothetical protein
VSSQDITIHSGDTPRIIINVTDCAGAAVDITGATVAYYWRTSPSGAAVVTKTPTIAGSQVTVQLDPADTTGSGSYFHELIVSGDYTQTVLIGYARVEYAIATSCYNPLTGVIDPGLLSASSVSLDFSIANNSQYIALI